jgi:tetratricopeptide (TPR) repeat protein
MAGQYGVTFAAKLIEKGKYEQAIVEATQAIAREDDNPEHYWDRGSAHSWLHHYREAIGDFERALSLDEAAGVLDSDALDDAYFSALLGAAKQTTLEEGLRLLEQYRALLPEGRHTRDAEDWQKRLKGELKSSFTKVRD